MLLWNNNYNSSAGAEKTYDVTEVMELQKIQSYAVKASEILNESWGYDENGIVLYPDNVGGVWIDYDKLVIGYTEINDDIKDNYNYLFGDLSEYVVFRPVRYSYNELLEKLECTKKIVDMLLKEDSFEMEYYIDEEKNSIHIGLDSSIFDLYEKQIYENIDFDNLYIERYESARLTSRKAGQTLKNSNTSEEFTLGCCGTYNGQYIKAVLTCGHVDQSVGNSICYGNSNTAIGTVGVHNFYNNSYGDYEIIQLTSDNTITNKLVNNVTINASVSSSVQNTVVYFYGASSATTKYGTVQTRNCSTSVKDYFNTYYNVNGLTKVSVSNHFYINSGDSGGPVYTIIPSGIYAFCGILNACTESPFLEPCVYFTPYSIPNNAGFSAKLTNSDY